MSQTALTIGTAYTDRYMTGTGTEDDPWVIGAYVDTSHDLQNLLDALCTTGAYIKLLKDIDAAQDTTYREGMKHNIAISAAKLYADQNQAIKNLRIVCDDTPIYFESGSIICNIDLMVDISSSLCTLQSVDAATVRFEACNFTIQKDCLNGSPQFVDTSGAFSADHCSFYYEATNYAQTSRDIFCFTELTHSQIEYHGPIFQNNKLLTNGYIVGLRGFVDLYATGFTSYPRVLYSSSQCYAVFDAFTNHGPTAKLMAEGCPGINLIAAVQFPDNVAVTTSSTFLQITPEQLKDRDYLYSIGFLP